MDNSAGNKEDFDRVQQNIASRRRKRKNGTTQIFAGLVKCADCGWSMIYGTKQRKNSSYSYYNCSKYGQGIRQCSMSYVRYAEKRLSELDNLFARIYEDRLNEKITERNFSLLSRKYQQEQGELETRIKALTAQLDSIREQEDGVGKWIDLIRQFSSPSELTVEILNTLIEKILVHEADKDADGNRTQEIEIVYRFVGKID